MIYHMIYDDFRLGGKPRHGLEHIYIAIDKAVGYTDVIQDISYFTNYLKLLQLHIRNSNKKCNFFNELTKIYI